MKTVVCQFVSPLDVHMTPVISYLLNDLDILEGFVCIISSFLGADHASVETTDHQQFKRRIH